MTVERRREGIVSIESKGHSGFARRGEDIVCAAVSALMQALLVGIREISGKRCGLTERKSYMRLCWGAEIAAEVGLLSETVALSLERIAAAYPKNLKFSEVQLSDESVQSSDFRP